MNSVRSASDLSLQATATSRGSADHAVRSTRGTESAPTPVDVSHVSGLSTPAPASPVLAKAGTATLSAVAAEATTTSTTAVVGIAAGSAVAAGVFAGLKAGFVQGYMPPTEVLQRARDLARIRPDLVELVERPYQTHGYDGKREDLRGPAPLWYLRLGPRDAPDREHKVGVLQMAAPHAREWMQPMIMMELAEQLVAAYDPRSDDPAVRASTALLDGLDIHLLPVTNPDGQSYSFFDQDMWRKNRSPQADGGVGVDVNRNYPYKWDEGTDSLKATFAGPSAASEPETRHIMQMVDDHPNIRFVCDWHSHGEEVRRPWGVSPEDQPAYDAMQNRMAEAIASVRGHQYKVTESKVIHGASDDYFYQERGLFSTIVEDGTAFHPELAEALQVMREGVAGARELLQVALEYQQSRGLEPAHPPLVKPDDPPPDGEGEKDSHHAAMRRSAPAA